MGLGHQKERNKFGDPLTRAHLPEEKVDAIALAAPDTDFIYLLEACIGLEVALKRPVLLWVGYKIDFHPLGMDEPRVTYWCTAYWCP